MVTRLVRGYPLKCEKCGHEDVACFSIYEKLKELVFRINGYEKCPECGGKMRRDPDKFVVG